MKKIIYALIYLEKAKQEYISVNFWKETSIVKKSHETIFWLKKFDKRLIEVHGEYETPGPSFFGNLVTFIFWELIWESFFNEIRSFSPMILLLLTGFFIENYFIRERLYWAFSVKTFYYSLKFTNPILSKWVPSVQHRSSTQKGLFSPENHSAPHQKTLSSIHSSVQSPQFYAKNPSVLSVTSTPKPPHFHELNLSVQRSKSLSSTHSSVQHKFCLRGTWNWGFKT